MFALLIVAAALVRTSAGCAFRLDIVAGAPSLQFTGASAASFIPGSFPVEPIDPGTAFGLRGALYGSIEGETVCPTSEAGWRAAAPRLRISSAPSPYHFSPLQVTPDSMQLQVTGLPLNITDLQLNLTLSGSGPADAAGALPLSVDADVLGGRVFSDTPLTGGPQLQALPRQSSRSTASALLLLSRAGSSSSSAAAAAAPAPAQLTLQLQRLNLTFVSRTSGSVAGRPWTGSLTFSLSGPLNLTGVVGCPVDCGTRGRCVQVAAAAAAINASAASSTPASAPAAAGGWGCECECGWAADPGTGRCEVPAGSCPLYLSGSAAAAAAAGGRAAAGVGDGAAAAANGACPTGFGFDVFARTCNRCEADWAGPGCGMCTTDKACQARLALPAAICSTGLLFNERSREKQYACTLSDPSIARLIGPVLPLTCTTGGKAAAGGQQQAGQGGKPRASSALAVDDASLLSSAASCSISMRLVGMPVGTSAMCTATGCHFTAGNPSFACDGVACDCPSGCPASYLKTFRDVSGAVTLDCDTTGADCSIVLGSLNIKIKASCDAAECLDPAGPKVVSSTPRASAGPPLAPPLLAAVPLLLLLLGSAACAALLARNGQLLQAAGGGTSSRVANSSGQRDQQQRGCWHTLLLPLAWMSGCCCSARRSALQGLAAGDAADDAKTISAGVMTASLAAVSTSGSATAAAPPPPAATAAAAAAAPLSRLGTGSGGGTCGGAPAAAGVVAAAAARPPQIQLISFHNVTADVRLPQHWTEHPLLRTLLMKGCYSSSSGNKGSTAAHQQQQAVYAAAAAADVEGGQQQQQQQVWKSKGGIATAAAAATAAAQQHHEAPGLLGGPKCDNNNSSSVTKGVTATGVRWRPVLRGVSGGVASGQVMGVLGPSGGGKSTLLLKLCGALGAAGRSGGWRSGGLVCLDGVAAPPSLLASVTALVPQDDSLLRSLTVEECVRYSAALRLDPGMSAADVGGRVEAVLHTLGLARLAGATVLSGTGVAGVSGGERRRVAIAMELVTEPQVLVLDEPLSGLDAHTARQLISSLRTVAAGGRAVALSLHQPSPSIFAALDTAMLLAGGRALFSGPPAAAAGALAALGCSVPAGATVAEHLLEVVSDPDSLAAVTAAAAAAAAAGAGASAEAAGAAAVAAAEGARAAAAAAAGRGAFAGPGGAAAAAAAAAAAGSTAAGCHGHSASSDSGPTDQGGVTWSLASVLSGYGSSMPPPPPQQQQQQQLLLPPSSGGKAAGGGLHTPPGSLGGAAAAAAVSGRPQQYRGRADSSSAGGGAWWSLRTAAGAALSPRASAAGAARAALGLPRRRRAPGRDVGVLFWRGGLDMLRNPLLTGFHAGGALALGLLVGLIFLQVRNDTSGAQNRVGALFFALCLLAFTSVTAVDLVQAEAGPAGREMSAKYYTPAAYAATKLVLDGLLLRALPAVLFGLPFYFLMGLSPEPRAVVTFLFVIVTFSAAVGAAALAAAAALDSPGKTILVMNMILLLGVLFGGFLANKTSMPPWLGWVSWLSVFRYAWEALAINELAGLDLFLSAPGVSISLPVRGDVFLSIIGVNPGLLALNIGVLVAMYAVAAAAVVGVICWRHRQRPH